MPHLSYTIISARPSLRANFPHGSWLKENSEYRHAATRFLPAKDWPAQLEGYRGQLLPQLIVASTKCHGSLTPSAADKLVLPVHNYGTIDGFRSSKLRH